MDAHRTNMSGRHTDPQAPELDLFQMTDVFEPSRLIHAGTVFTSHTERAGKQIYLVFGLSALFMSSLTLFNTHACLRVLSFPDIAFSLN